MCQKTNNENVELMEKKNIWIVNAVAMPPQFEPRLQTIKLAQYLIECGYDVTIFASSIMHNMNIDLIKDKSMFIEKSYDNIRFVHIKTLRYGQSHLKRLLGAVLFRNRMVKISSQFSRPDVIIHVPEYLLDYRISKLAKKIKAKYIVQVLDLYPESIVELGLLKKSNPIIKVLQFFEKKMYLKADEVIFSMEGGPDYISDQQWDCKHGGPIDIKKLHYVNNGVDLKDFEYNKTHYILDDPDLLSTKTKKILYLGSIRMANNLMQLIYAAECLKNRADITFLIYGDGEDRPKIEKYCKEKNLTNVVLKDKWVEPQYVPFIVSHVYLHVLNYKPQGFGHYGGSQSKMFQYMASGRPIICNINMAYCLITKYQIGIAKEFHSPQEYSEAIENIIDLPIIEYEEMCLRAKNAAKEFDYEYLTSKIIPYL